MSKLCHLADLPNNSFYLSVEIKHLLPIHYPRFADNLLTIIHNQSRNMQWPVYFDPKLSLTQHQYALISGGWCEDIDQQKHHLKATLELSAIVLNYLHSLIHSPSNQQAQKPINLRINHQFFNKKHPTELLQDALSPIIAYNMYRKQDKSGKQNFIFIVGRHHAPSLRLFSLINTFRNWNLSRLKSDSCSSFFPIRIHRIIEHMMVILRNFMWLQDQDDQTRYKQLQQILENINEQQALSEQSIKKIDPSQSIIVSKFQFHYKDKLQDQQLLIFCAKVLMQVIKITPANAHVSFAGKTIYSPDLNQIVILWITAYHLPLVTHTVRWVDQTHIQAAVRKTMQFMRAKSLENIKQKSANIADQILKSSLKVLHRYQTQQQMKAVTGAKSPQSSTKKLGESYGEDRSSRAHQFDRLSMISKISFKQRVLPQSKSKVTQYYESLNTPLTVYRDKDYAELLVTIQSWEKLYGSIIPSNQLKQALRQNCSKAKLLALKNPLSKKQIIIMQALSAAKYILDPQQVIFLLQNYKNMRQTIFQILFQQSNASYLLQVGNKIAQQMSYQLYSDYITHQFKIDQNHILVNYLKRYVAMFAGSSQLYQIGDKISMPLMLSFLEGQSPAKQTWHTFVLPIIHDVFRLTPQIKVLSPFLIQIFLKLSEDHHQELINSFIADLCFDLSYFCFDNGFISNLPYKKEQNLKQKKLLQLLRQYGFNLFGFELKNILKPLIFEYKQYKLPSSRIYDQLIITKPAHIYNFINMVIQSHSTHNLLEISSFFKSLKKLPKIEKPVTAVFLKRQITGFNFKAEQSSWLSMQSQSGIFRQLFEYNPQMKIAGKSLSEVFSERKQQSDIANSRFQVDYLLKQMRLNLQQTYEYIQMMVNLKSRYENFDSLTEEQKIYLREIMHQVLCRKNEIQEYLLLEGAVKEAMYLQNQTWIY